MIRSFFFGVRPPAAAARGSQWLSPIMRSFPLLFSATVALCSSVNGADIPADLTKPERPAAVRADDTAPAPAPPLKPQARALWEASLVTIEIARNTYDYNQPWSRRTRRLKKTGVVVGERQVLTSADQLFDRTLVRLQKQGRGQWYVGEVEWIDYPANLALITTSDQAFWRDLKPATFGKGAPEDGAMQILRWRDGNLENRRAEFSQFTVREGALSPVNCVMLEASSDIQGGGWGEPIVANSHLLGILIAQEGRTCFAAPASFIQSILQARQKNQFRGLGYFHWYWQPAENPASLAALGLPGEPRGVIVHFVPDRPDGRPEMVKSNDIVLSIDGFPLDIQGDYLDPEFGNLLLENLATRNRWAGDDVPMQVWRDGKQIDVTYRLPRYNYTNSLLPFAVYDQEPEYLIVGGLVFQPLSNTYLQSWGNEWKRRAPFRLYYYNNQMPTKERPSLVLMAQVLPDAYNIGYQDLRYLVLDKVNGIPISNLNDLREAFKKPEGGFHVLEFVKSDGLRRLVLAAGDPELAATDRVLKRYGIAAQFHINN